jgi:protoporphyrinogen oxidase
MMQKSIAVIGGGISSLSFALSLAKKINFKENVIQLNLYERK